MDHIEVYSPSFLLFSPQLWEELVADVKARAPQEACGLVAGKGNDCLAVYPLTNIHHSPIRYQIDPQEQFNTFQIIEKNGWDLLAIYHSHPQGLPTLSASDIAEAYYPDSVYLVWYPVGEAWNCRGFLVRRDTPEEIEIRIIGSEAPQDSSSLKSSLSS